MRGKGFKMSLSLPRNVRIYICRDIMLIAVVSPLPDHLWMLMGTQRDGERGKVQIGGRSSSRLISFPNNNKWLMIYWPPLINPFLYPSWQAYKMRPSSAVQIARIISVAVIVSSLIIGSFILASSYIQARAACDQMQALDDMLGKELMLETLQVRHLKAHDCEWIMTMRGNWRLCANCVNYPPNNNVPESQNIPLDLQWCWKAKVTSAISMSWWGHYSSFGGWRWRYGDGHQDYKVHAASDHGLKPNKAINKLGKWCRSP